jgi:membrane protein implicated in regulation of membrane protease activity
MTDSTLWWLLAGAAIVLELLTGTFYLLMLAIGLCAAALAAHAGATQTVQLVVAALVGGGAVIGWSLFFRRKNAARPAPGTNRDVNLDIGETVQITSWHADGTAGVKYRGTHWTAVPAADGHSTTGSHRIVAVRGNQLVVEKIES